MSSGHEVDGGELEQTGRDVREIPQHAVEQPLAAVRNIQLVAADFGRGHTASFQPYADGVNHLVKSAESYLGAADEFGGKLSSGAQQYGANEDSTEQTIREKE